MPNLKHVVEELRMPGFVPHIYSAQVLVYNPDNVTDPPHTFGDLLDPKWKGKIGMVSTVAPWVLMAASLYETGKTTDFDKAKAFMLKLNANGLRLYPETDALAPAFKSGEISVGVIWLARTFMWQNAGFPVKGNFPKEGAILYVSGMVVPKNAPNQEAAYKYMNAMLDPRGAAGVRRAYGLPADGRRRAAVRQGGRATGVPRSEAEAGHRGLSGVRAGDAGPERLVVEEYPARVSVAPPPRSPSAAPSPCGRGREGAHRASRSARPRQPADDR